MSTEESVTRWIGELKMGDDEAVRKLWEKYFKELVRLARARLQRSSKTAGGEEEDVALSAFNSFWEGATRGRFPQLDDRDNLWRILVKITERKAQKRARRERTLKRGAGKVRPVTDLGGQDGEQEGWAAVEQVIGREPTPYFAAMVAEEYRRLLDMLDDERLRQIAVDKLEGYTNEEIAARLDCARQTVTRKLDLIRRRWLAEHPG